MSAGYFPIIRDREYAKEYLIHPSKHLCHKIQALETDLVELDQEASGCVQHFSAMVGLISILGRGWSLQSTWYLSYKLWT